jgi:hypothetical protein
MTAQIPDKLINECPDVNLSGLYLYGVITGDIQSNYGWGMTYPFRHKPRPPKSGGSSANWRGYVASYRLASDGRLKLVSYNYPTSAQKEREEVNEPLMGDNWIIIQEEPFGPGTEEVEEQLVGDFWIVMKEEFFGSSTFNRGQVHH